MDRLKILKSDEGEACGPGCGCSSGESSAPAEAQDPSTEPGLTLEAVKERLDGTRGRRYWKSLEELAETPGFQEMLEREFPRGATEWLAAEDGGVSRRRFLQLSSASMALAGLTACTRQPLEKIVPYVKQPEQIVPGRPQFYATAFQMGGYAQGVLAESHEGRPTKIEGNPDHPANPGGGTDLFAQASVLQLYDPDRSGTLTYLGQIRTWNDFKRELTPQIQAWTAVQGDGLRILTPVVTSPTLAAQMRDLMTALPKARWHQYDPATRNQVRQGATRAFGEPVEVRYELADADVIVSLDSDFLTQGPGAVRHAHQWAERRRAGAGAGGGEDAQADPAAMNRMYVLESSPTNTGSCADHRLALPPSEIAGFALALAANLGVAGADAAGVDFGDRAEEAERWVRAVADDLRSHRGRGVVIAGDDAPAAVHVLAHAINQELGAVGTTVVYTDTVAAEPVDEIESLRSLVDDLNAGAVDTLFILGANPVFDAPADLDFANALTGARQRVHLGLYKDETAEYCQWHLPMAHYLESWGDARSQDGTVSVVQPLVDPLYKGHSAHDLLALLAGKNNVTAYQLVREHWKGHLGLDFERAWRRVLHDGIVPDTAFDPKTVTAGGVSSAAADVLELLGDRRGDAGGMELSLRPDPTLWDGSLANNAWLQELPKPATRTTWDNAVLMSPATGETMGIFEIRPKLVHERPMVKVTVGEKSLEMPVWVVPGHADDCVTIHFGHGRRRAGKIGDGVGFDVYPLRTTDALWHTRATIEPTGRHYPMATTQDHHSMEGRNLVRTGAVAAYEKDPALVREMDHEVSQASFYEGFEYDGYAWGMAVDLNACTGCNACVVACQSENNIPIVGKEQVIKGREMHWIRIDRYFEGDNPDVITGYHHQPVMCQQCEQAPCEPVCPVGATVHSSEGLNDMVYNRCVGTRYCSNNCPYKVRRFNFLKYTDHTIEVEKMVRNPDVTVRMRGVMEKCTYCVQRISHARIDAKVAGQRGRGDGKIHDGAVRTACQQACPSQALIFGDINDPTSEVTRRKAEPLNYSLLEELGTRPRTTYLAKLRNPNPQLEPAQETGGTEHGSH